MKNLKKVLSLALAFAMVLGLCIGASAADVTTLNDWDEVENQSAATLLGAFNIMKGDDEGNFRPNDNVTRAEAAKMISVALWGGSDDVALYNAGNIGGYPDVVSGSWYMGYVNYMTVQTIMKGDDAGTFRPNGDVTGYELLKMCLVSLGYNPETEGLVGAGWDVKTMALATKPGFKNLTADTTVTNWSAPLSRTNAAQIIANMIYRDTVKYSLTQGGVGGNSTAYVESNKVTFGESVLGMTATKGTLVANPYGTITTEKIDNTKRDYKGQNAIVEYKTAKLDEDGKEVKENGKVVMETKYIELEMNTDFEDLGLAVQMYIVNGKVVSANMTGPAPTDIAFNFTEGKVTNVEDDAIGYVNNEKVVKTPAVAADPGNGVEAKPAVYKTGKELAWNALDADCEVRAYDTDNDGYIELVMVYQFAVKDVKGFVESETFGNVINTGNTSWRESAYSKPNATIPTSFLLQADFTAAKDDKIAVVELSNCFKGQKTNHGYVLGVVEGKVTRLSTDAKTAYIDGVKYANKDYTPGATESDPATANFAVGSEGKFWTYANGTIATSDVVGGNLTSGNYALIYDAGYDKAGTDTGIASTVSYKVQVAAALSDGKSGVYDVASVTYVDTADNNKVKTVQANKFDTTLVETTLFGGSGLLNDVKTGKDQLFAYTLTDGKINLIFTAPTSESKINAPDAITVTSSDLDVKQGGNKLGANYISGKSVTYVQIEDGKTPGVAEKWVVFTGTNTPNYTLKQSNASGVAANPATIVTKAGYLGDNANTEVLFAALTKAQLAKYGEVTTGGIFYLLDAPDNLGDGKYVVSRMYNSETNKVEKNVEYTGTAGAKETVYTTFSSTDGLDGAVTPSATNAGFVTSVDGKTFAVHMAASTSTTEAVQVWTLADKAKFYVINGDDTTEGAIGDLTVQASIDDVKDSYKPATAEAAGSKGYQVIVIAAKDASGNEISGTAGTVVIFANPQSITIPKTGR